MSEVWYYAEGTETRGPLSLAELVGILSRISDPGAVLVWRSGLENWTAAGAVREIHDRLFQPPPLPPRSAASVSAEQPRIQNPAVTPEEAAAFKGVRHELVGIGGWLVLVAIGQVVGPLKMLASLLPYYAELDPTLIRRFPVAVWGEAAMNAAVLVLGVYTAVLFFRHSRKFPLFFIYELVAATLLPLVSIVWAGVTLALYTGRPFAEFASFEPKEVGQSIAAAIASAIWIAYILKSRRVANTFIR